MSQFRIEKRRAEAALTLTTGATVRGCFFLADSSASHAGPERVADLLNAETGFFPFELNAGSNPYTVLYNRSHLVLVTLLEDTVEARLDQSTTRPPSARSASCCRTDARWTEASARTVPPGGIA